MTPAKNATDVSATNPTRTWTDQEPRATLSESPDVGAARHEPTPDADIGSMSQVRRTSPG
jgi:hypothetical protein